MSDQRELSLRLYDILEMVGASEKMRKLHQRTATTHELLSGYHYREHVFESQNKQSSAYNCGSSYEGTVTPDIASDVDLIMILNENVVPHRLNAGPGLFFHMVRDEWTRPGYSKLQVMIDGRPITVHDLPAINDLALDREGRACMIPLAGENTHGPARRFFNARGVHIVDQVAAYKCRGIPLFATEWITRNRHYDWPSPELIDETKMMGCLFVGVGHFASPEKELEWRISFSLQERRLMKNPVQHKVYILLKMVKNNVLEKCLKVESLSSYHCKTCVFYMAETTPASVWVPENVISCLLQCLTLLLRWVRGKFCPSFFLKDQNLFDKEGFQGLVGPLQRLLDLLLQTGHQFLFLIQSDCVGEMLRGREMRLFKHVSDENLGNYLLNIKARTIHVTLYIGRISSLRASRKSDLESLSFYVTTLDTMLRNNHVEGYTIEQTRDVSSYISPWLHLSIGLEYAARALTCPNRHESRELMMKVDIHLQQARNTDLVNVRLAQASILLSLEKLDECFLLLQEIENSWTWRVESACPCARQSSMIRFNNDEQKNEMLSLWKDASARRLMRKNTATCVMFEPSQVELVPPPLRYEMFRSLGMPPGSRDEWNDAWFDWVVVDAKVYLYLLQYMVCSKLNREPHKQIALGNMTSLVQYDAKKELHHKETAYNVLGWIYLQEHRVDDAIWCFNLSWELRPFHNATKLHLLELCIRMAAERAGQQDNPLG